MTSVTPSQNGSVVVVVAAWNEPPEGLEKTLSGLLRQQSPASSIVVVDDGSSTPLDVSPEQRSKIMLERLPTNVGLSEAKNIGAALTDSDYLLFVNVDFVLRPDWIESAVSFMAGNPEAGMVGGAIVPVVGRKLLRDWRLQFLEPKVHRAALTEELTEPKLVGWLDGHTVLIPRVVFDELGGYDRALRSSGEDWDFSQKVISSGRSLFYLPQLVAECIENVTLDSLARKSIRNLRWDLRSGSTERPPDPAVRPLRPLAASADVLRALLDHSGRNLLKGRLSLIPVDFAVAFRSLTLVWVARAR